MHVDTSRECHEWLRNCNDWGYGIHHHAGETLAHRVAWTLQEGPIPEGMLVCHHCDNPPCCRIDHLFLGTHHDNTADMLAKRRFTNAKLSRNDILSLRRMRNEGALWREIAAHFNMSIGGVWDAYHREHIRVP